MEPINSVGHSGNIASFSLFVNTGFIFSGKSDNPNYHYYIKIYTIGTDDNEYEVLFWDSLTKGVTMPPTPVTIKDSINGTTLKSGIFVEILWGELNADANISIPLNTPNYSDPSPSAVTNELHLVFRDPNSSTHQPSAREYTLNVKLA
jgi:hypothetical protein